MDWKATYRQKLTTVERAIELVRSGQRVYVHPGCATPEPLLNALAARAADLRDVEIVHGTTLGEARYTGPECDRSFRHNALFIGANVRAAAAAGRVDYTPVSMSEIERLFVEGDLPIDVAIVQASAPDNDGLLSLGVSVESTLTALECAKQVIVEVNERMPRTCGETRFPLSRAAALVETSRPLLEAPFEPVTEVHRRIAGYIEPLIPDEATLQVGIGGTPGAALDLLAGRRNLGLHSEMCPDGVIGLVESGALSGSAKNTDRGKAVAAFALGSQRLFDLVRDNPLFEFRRASYTNDPFVIAQNDRMIAINSAIQVDLTGQVCADSIGCRPYSGFGGQLDFIRGAARSRGGAAIIGLPATARQGSVSRIVGSLDRGAGVVTTRADVHYIVTENGVARMRGRTLRQRAEALISIADPKFRDELHAYAVHTCLFKPEPVHA
jgi:4-hydroxybutyrate CoA-transferase